MRKAVLHLIVYEFLTINETVLTIPLMNVFFNISLARCVSLNRKQPLEASVSYI